jgi:hypothetical protein
MMNCVERDALRIVRKSIDNILNGDLCNVESEGKTIDGLLIRYSYLAAVVTNNDEITVFLPEKFRQKNIFIVYGDNTALKELK